MFQSTLPTRGSDKLQILMPTANDCFNPRSPRGGATFQNSHDGSIPMFQSTLPTRGSDLMQLFYPIWMTLVSIHAPHEGERRIRCPTPVRRSACFNPRSPRGGATTKTIIAIVANMFQSTLPTRGSDYMTHAKPNRATKFQSTLPTRGSDAQL